MNLIPLTNCNSNDIQAVLNNFESPEERQELSQKFEFRKESSYIIKNGVDILGYTFGYEYDGKSKIELFVNKSLEKSELLKLADEINKNHINKEEKSFFIIEEAEDSAPILDNFKALDSNYTYQLLQPIKSKKSNKQTFNYAEEKIPVTEYEELMKECFFDDKEWDYSNYKEQAEDFFEEENNTWSCRENGKLIGACTVCDEDDIAFLDMLCTKPGYQNTGIGYSLVKKALENAAKPIFLDVKSKNENAIKFYKNIGFEKTKTSYIVVKKAEVL